MSIYVCDISLRLSVSELSQKRNQSHVGHDEKEAHQKYSPSNLNNKIKFASVLYSLMLDPRYPEVRLNIIGSVNVEHRGRRRCTYHVLSVAHAVSFVFLFVDSLFGFALSVS